MMRQAFQCLMAIAAKPCRMANERRGHLAQGLKGQAAPAKAERVVQHDQARVLVGDLGEHVCADDADVHVAVHQLAHHVRRTLEPHLQPGHLRAQV